MKKVLEDVSNKTLHILTLEIFATDEAGVDIEMGQGHRTQLLKVKVKNRSEIRHELYIIKLINGLCLHVTLL